MVQISEVRLEPRGERQVLSGRIDGDLLYFDFPSHLALSARAEPFVAIGLFKAMAAAEPLSDLQAPLDPRLMVALPKVQAILTQWNPELAQVQVTAPGHAIAMPNPGVISSFSGGVDSTSTLFHHEAEITHLMTLNSFDGSAMGDDFLPLRAKTRRLGHRLGKSLVDIETNAHLLVTKHQMNWSYVHGPLLCLLAGSMGFSRFYIPSSGTYENLTPWGSHPLLDPLWSTTSTQIVHDGAEHRRSEKVEGFASRLDLLEQLQVCWKSQTENCGDCPKCARTLLVLNVLGVSKHARFPARSNAHLIDRLQIGTDAHAVFIGRDLVQFLERHGEGPLAARLRGIVHRYRLRRGGKRFLRSLVGDKAISQGRQLLGRPATSKKVRIIDPDDLP